jgi:TNF receptor-associated factor 4
MCVGVYPNSNGERKGTHTAVVVHLMKGEFDDELKWPFRGQITVRLPSHVDMDYKEFKYYFIETVQDYNTISSRQLTQEIGGGLCNFVSHTELQSQYLKHDCLKLSVHQYIPF